jgi:hypothetical protein
VAGPVGGPLCRPDDGPLCRPVDGPDDGPDDRALAVPPSGAIPQKSQ